MPAVIILAQSEAMAHVGLGQIEGLIDRIQIEWPSGMVQVLEQVQPNTTLLVVEPVPEAETLILLFSWLALLRGRSGRS